MTSIDEVLERFGVVYEEKQPDGSVKNVNLLAEGSYSKGSELTDGYPEFTYGLLKKLGWGDDLTEAEKKAAEGKNWKTDVSGGIQRVPRRLPGALLLPLPKPQLTHRASSYRNRK